MTETIPSILRERASRGASKAHRRGGYRPLESWAADLLLLKSVSSSIPLGLPAMCRCRTLVRKSGDLLLIYS
jgi:hypothetical protein